MSERKSSSGVQRGELVYQDKFEEFCKWSSINRIVREIPIDKLNQLDYTEEEHRFIAIKTQEAFREEYDVTRTTLAEWKKRPAFKRNVMEGLRDETFFKQAPRVIASFTNAVIKNPTAQNFQVWINFFTDHAKLLMAEQEEDRPASVIMDGETIAMLALTRLRMKGQMGKQDFKRIEEVENAEVLPSETVLDFDKMDKNQKQIEKEDAEAESEDAPKSSTELKDKILAKIQKYKKQ